MLECFVGAVPHPKGHRHDVVRVIAIRILTQGTLEVVERAGMIPRIERDGCGIHAFGWRTWRGGLPGGLALADAQVEPRAFKELALVRIALQNGAEKTSRPREIVSLQGLNPALVDSHGLVELRLPGGRGRFKLHGEPGHTRRRLRSRGSTPGPDRSGPSWSAWSGFLCGFGPFDTPGGPGGCLYGPALLRHAPPANVLSPWFTT